MKLQILERKAQPSLSHLLLTQMTQTQFTPFIINLTKVQQGYTFHSLEEQQQPQVKSKKPKPPQTKNIASKATNRLIKEIGLISDLPPLIQEESMASKQPPNNQEAPPRLEFEPAPQQEEIDCEVKRDFPLPACPAEWFDYKTIHPIQVDIFPQFYSGRSYKTKELYQCYRNFMIDAYQKNPNRYLTFVSLRRVLRGDASCLLKIFTFLQDEGIINYCISNQGNYSFQIPAMDKVSQLAKRPQSYVKKLPEQTIAKKDEQMDTDNLTVTVINKNFSRTFRVYCLKCKLICGIVWYSTIEQNQKSLCFDCFNKSQPESVRQFVKVDILKKMQNSKDNKQVSKTTWGLQDNIKLLDYMGNCSGRSWSELLNQFEGKKALQDIIIQFMQFPITNYDPQAHVPLLKHQQIDYTQQQHVNMLMGLYQKSEFAIKQQTKEEEDNIQEYSYHGNQASKFHTYSNLILKKYIDKMDNLRKIETALEETSLTIIEQPLCNRIRVTQASPNEQNEEQINQDDE